MADFIAKPCSTGLINQLRVQELVYAIGITAGMRYEHVPLIYSVIDGTDGAAADKFIGLSIGETLADTSIIRKHINLFDLFENAEDLKLIDAAALLRKYISTCQANAYSFSWDIPFWFDPNCQTRFYKIWCNCVFGWPKLAPRDYRAKYWHARKLDGYTIRKRKVAIHFRRGGVVMLPDTPQRYQPTIAAYPPINNSDLEPAIQTLCDAGLADDTILLSDGFGATYFDIINRIPPNKEQLEKAQILTQELRSLASKYGIASLISDPIKTASGLCETIHTLATTDLLLRTQGGFAAGCIERFARHSINVLAYPWDLDQLRHCISDIKTV